MGICSSKSSARTFTSAQAKGGCELDLSKTALVLIEYQNEFTTEGGKLHGAVAESMKATDMLAKSAKVVAAARVKGITVIHAPIMFKEDASDNPNKGIGILAGCAKDKLFTAGTWNADFHESMKPAKGDIVVNGKRGLTASRARTWRRVDRVRARNAIDATMSAQANLKRKEIETVVLSGFLTNCCVESTMRTAYEKGTDAASSIPPSAVAVTHVRAGFNTITLTDCCATTSLEGHKGATEGTFGMFSSPMTGEEFLEKIAA